MNCPLCNKKMLIHIESGDDMPGPSFTCPSSIYLEHLNLDFPHYSKQVCWVNHYEEVVYLPPYKLLNNFEHTDRKAPYCKIFALKLEYEIGDYKNFKWVEVVTLNHTVGILPYKRMRDRIKSIILLS